MNACRSKDVNAVLKLLDAADAACEAVESEDKKIKVLSLHFGLYHVEYGSDKYNGVSRGRALAILLKKILTAPTGQDVSDVSRSGDAERTLGQSGELRGQ